MIQVTIKCPITWYKQCDWIRDNCVEWEDKTCWAAWQIGFDDIYFMLNDEDAILFKLIWG